MIEKNIIGKLSDGREVHAFTLFNNHGERVRICEFGASILEVVVLDRDGRLGDVVLGPRDFEELVSGWSMTGVTCGRVANRIKDGRFQLNGETVQLECNMFGHFMHGASGAYGTKLFLGIPDEESNSVTMEYLDEGEGGFNNLVKVSVRFSFNDAGELQIEYDMVGEEDTLLCPTNHSYFNLNGTEDVRKLVLKVYSDSFAVKGGSGMPEGDVSSVVGTPLDFSQGIQIGDSISETNADFFTRTPPELDDVFILNNLESTLFTPAAELTCLENGRKMTVYTDMPALIVFTMFQKKAAEGKNGQIYSGYCSIALETQYVPNAVNTDSFEKPIFKAGEHLLSKTIYKFETV